VKTLTLANGQLIPVEVMSTLEDLRRGMSFRTSFAPAQGMLFLHSHMGKHPYWMYRVRIPLDIVWIDQSGNIVSIVSNAQPCSELSVCQRYVSDQPAQYVLEVPAGMAKQYGLQIGQRVSWQ
jgi:uncharacterized membrane protein (UPF0127 family)